MNSAEVRFNAASRALHWGMAALILVLLFSGAALAATLSTYYGPLVSMHRSLGIATLALAGLRLVNRALNPPPPLPQDLARWQRRLANGSHVLLYALMVAMPLVGWGMLSAASYPIIVFGSWELPPILPPNAAVHALLRRGHTYLAYLLFSVLLAHAGAALFHGFIRRDGVLRSMARGRRRGRS